MRRLLPGVVALAAAIVAGASGQTAAPKGTLKPGDDLPGPFHPFNVTGPEKGRFHDLVSAYGLEPVVLVLASDVPGRDSPLGQLLTRLDDAIDRSPRGSLHAFVVFVPDGLPDVVQDDDARVQLAKKVTDLANADPPLKHVVLCLDSKGDVKGYPLDKEAASVVVYEKYRVVSVRPLGKDDEGKKAVDAVLDEVRAKFKLKKPKK